MKIYLASGFTVCQNEELEREFDKKGTGKRLQSYFFYDTWKKGFLPYALGLKNIEIEGVKNEEK